MAKPGAKPKKAKKQRKATEDDIDEDEDEEDEEFDAEAEEAREKKKRRNVFVDDAADEEDGVSSRSIYCRVIVLKKCVLSVCQRHGIEWMPLL